MSIYGRRRIIEQVENNRSESVLKVNGKSIDTSIDDRSVHLTKGDKITSNGTGSLLLYKKLDDESLISMVEKLMENVSVENEAITYNQIVLNIVVPELLERLKGDK